MSDEAPATYSEIEMQERLRVCSEAESWVGTPYHSNADIKGAGVDCGMILLRIFSDAGVVEYFDPRPYPAQWPLHQSGEAYLAILQRYAYEIEGPPGPGDVVMFKVGKTWAHGAIVCPEWPWVVHATPPGPVDKINIAQNQRIRRMTPRFFSVWPRDHSQPIKPRPAVEVPIDR